MSQITAYYLNAATYIAVDDAGQRIDISVDYWNNTYSLSRPHPQLEAYAKSLLQHKHRTNFIAKLRSALNL